MAAERELETIRVCEEDGVAHVTFSRPAVLNAFDETMERELRETVQAIAASTTVRVVVLRGAGEHFMSGADIGMLQRWMALDPAIDLVDELDGLFTPTMLEALPQPVIAAVDGYALGMGCEIALGCDFRILTDRATIGLPEIRLGVIPGAGGTQRLARVAGRTRATEMVLADTRIGAEEALAWGVAGRVVPAEQLDDEVDKLVRRLLSLSPLALRNAKRALLAAGEGGLQLGVAVERRLFTDLVRSEDAHEGTQAFLEKRRPVFVGR